MGPPASTDRLDLWRDLIRDNFVALDIVAERPETFTGSVHSTDVGHLDIARVESGPQIFTRTSRLAQRDDDVYLQVGLLTRGAAVVAQDGRECELAPGDFTLYESDRPFCWALAGDWELLVFTWPRTSVRLHDTISQSLTARRLAGNTGISGIVGRTLRDLATTPPDLSIDGGIRVGNEIAGLVTTAALEQARPGEPVPTVTSLLRRIDDYIIDRLSDPNLDPPEIAAAHFISTRHLHRLFAGRGSTVTQRILHERLTRCCLELRHPSADGRSITDISRRWGFADLASFSRAFRAAYGMTPTQYRTARAGNRGS